MDPLIEHEATLTRRHFFSKAAGGIGVAALWSMLAQDAASSAIERLLDDVPHFAPKAKRVIYLFQNGAPSHVDLFRLQAEAA